MHAPQAHMHAGMQPSTTLFLIPPLFICPILPGPHFLHPQGPLHSFGPGAVLFRPLASAGSLLLTPAPGHAQGADAAAAAGAGCLPFSRCEGSGRLGTWDGLAPWMPPWMPPWMAWCQTKHASSDQLALEAPTRTLVAPDQNLVAGHAPPAEACSLLSCGAHASTCHGC